MNASHMKPPGRTAWPPQHAEAPDPGISSTSAVFRENAQASAGFTLVEIMLVLFILALTSALVVPRIGAGMKRMADRELLQEFTQTLRGARLMAMNSNRVVAFRINGAERGYGMESPPARPIPENVDIFADGLEQDPDTGDFIILFYPDGSITGSDVELLFDRERRFRIFLHPLFGTVSVEKLGEK